MSRRTYRYTKVERRTKRGEKLERRKQYAFVVRELTAREIKRRYSRSCLGILWSVLNPLLMMGVLSMIFSQLFRRSIDNFPIYYLTGYILWQMFTGSTNAAMTTLADNSALLIKVKLPLEVFVLARVYTALVNLGYSAAAYAVMLLVFRVGPNGAMLFSPVIILLLLLFSLGISFILAAAYVFFGDVKHLYSVLLTVWMYCSGIFYPVDRMERIIRTAIELNPVYCYIDALRGVVMYGVMPSAQAVFYMAVWAFLMCGTGYYIFRGNKNRIMQRI